ncbi:hypothetical protein VTN31DRAFT_1680 [Thermomyces dupontii]|uniref:uncharacterized protein n=1 Tax=Talaromyces thermophilus TaxID=28565 RepID=UPI0037434655
MSSKTWDVDYQAEIGHQAMSSSVSKLRSFCLRQQRLTFESLSLTNIRCLAESSIAHDLDIEIRSAHDAAHPLAFRLRAAAAAPLLTFHHDSLDGGAGNRACIPYLFFDLPRIPR